MGIVDALLGSELPGELQEDEGMLILQTLGVTSAQLIELGAHGIPAGSYVLCKLAGATHAEVMDVYRVRRDFSELIHYGAARIQGAEHGLILELSKKGLPVQWFDILVAKFDLGKRDLQEVLSMGIDHIDLYLEARKAGRTHTESLALHC